MYISLVVLQGLLDTQLAGQPFLSSEFLSDYLRVFQASTDAAIIKMLQIKLLIPVSSNSVDFVCKQFNFSFSNIHPVLLHIYIRGYVCVCVPAFVWCVDIQITCSVCAQVYLYTYCVWCNVCVHSCTVQGVSCLLLVDHVTIIHSLGSQHICHTTEGT